MFLYADFPMEFSEMLKNEGIWVERVLSGVHPFSIVGDSDESMQSYLKTVQDVSSITSIKKNFYNMLTRDPEQYESNYFQQPHGKNVDSYNTTEYIVICFNSMMKNLYKIGQEVYSDIEAENEFVKNLRKNEPMKIPYKNSSNWKYYVEMFADACVRNYPSSHIILIRMNPSYWLIDKDKIVMNDLDHLRMEKYIGKIEDYFIEMTHCNCVDELQGMLPSREVNSSNMAYIYRKLSESIKRKIYNNEIISTDFYKYKNDAIQQMYKRLNKREISEIKNEFDRYDLEIKEAAEEHFFSSGKWNSNGKKFIKDNYTLSDCIFNKDTVSIDILVWYTEKIKLDVNDIISVYLIYEKIGNEEVLRETIRNICGNPNVYPLKSTMNFLKKNADCLLDYVYLDQSFVKDIKYILKNERKLYPVRISESSCIVLSPESDKLMQMIEWNESIPNIKNVVDDGMLCSIHDVNCLLESWEFYIKRAKRGKGNHPLMVIFEDHEEFLKSMFFVDYKSVLENENIVIILKDHLNRVQNLNFEKFESKTNLEKIIDKNVKIVYLQNGLADQIRHYIFSKEIERISGAEMIYDDMFFIKEHIFNGLELQKIVRDEFFSKKLLSNILSKKLRESYRKGTLDEILYNHGCKDVMTLVSNEFKVKLNKRVTHVAMVQKNREGISLAANICFKYYMFLGSPEMYISLKDRESIKKHFSFPKFNNEENRKLADEIRCCDAIIIQVRLGDRAAIFPHDAPKPEFYYNAINKLININTYKNKKYYIFSDDMKWVKEHEEKMGLNLINKENIRYVDHNKGEESFWDMKLMSLGKVMIFGGSGFPRMAALLNSRLEVILSQSNWVNVAWRTMGWKNKYELL